MKDRRKNSDKKFRGRASAGEAAVQGLQSQENADVGLDGPQVEVPAPEPAFLVNRTALRPYQQRWVMDRSRFAIAVKSAQIGYSTASAAWAVSRSIHIPRRTVIFLSRSERQALELAEKAKNWIDGYQGVAAGFYPGVPFGGTSALQHEIRFPNGSRIIVLAANPDTARGYTGDVVLDEFAFHKDSQAIFTAVYRQVSLGFSMRVLSTPNGQQGKFYELAKELGLDAGIRPMKQPVRVPLSGVRSPELETHPESGVKDEVPRFRTERLRTERLASGSGVANTQQVGAPNSPSAGARPPAFGRIESSDDVLSPESGIRNPASESGVTSRASGAGSRASGKGKALGSAGTGDPGSGIREELPRDSAGAQAARLTPDPRSLNPWSGHWCDIWLAVEEGLPLDPDEVHAGCDEDTWLQEYCCQFVSQASEWISPELYQSCVSSEASVILSAAKDLRSSDEALRSSPGGIQLAQGSLYAGWDIARKHDLSVIWINELVGDVTWTRGIIEMRNLATPEQIREARGLMPFVRRMMIDKSGMGLVIFEALEREFPGQIEGVQFTQQTKEAMAVLAKRRMEEMRVRLPDSSGVRQSFRSVKKSVNAIGQVRFDAEHDARFGHADHWWAFCMAEAAAQQPVYHLAEVGALIGRPVVGRMRDFVM